MYIYPEAMKRNLELTRGLVFSQPVLLLLTKSGLSREEAYKIVQHNAMQVWELAAEAKDPHITFRSLLESDQVIGSKLTAADLDHAFDPMAAMKHIDTIFMRVGLK